MEEQQDDLTQMLQSGASQGELFPRVYAELRKLAELRMGGERVNHTLQATALVHETYLRLVNDRDMDWKSRRHFFGAAAEAMRRVLVDHARRVRAEKRGGGRERVTITLGILSQDGDDPELLLALDEAFESLASEEPRSAEVARLRFYAGLTNEDVARALEISPRTVARDWNYARARLTELLEEA